MVVVVILDVIVAWALLTFFEPVHKGLTTLAAWLRLSYAAIFAVAISQSVAVIPPNHPNAAALGTWRFSRPVARTGWDGVRDCAEFDPPRPQLTPASAASGAACSQPHDHEVVAFVVRPTRFALICQSRAAAASS
jgi:Domain of unknown function (DUF4386)